MTKTTYRLGLIVVFVLALIVPVVGIIFILNELELRRDAATRMSCQGRFSVLAHVMERYHDKHGHYPPAYVLGPDGKPWHSWRVLILRDGGIDGEELVKDYRFDEPWNGPNNSKLHSQMPYFYSCQGDRAKGYTNYFVVVGPGTAFPGAKPTKRSDITRPYTETILVVEAAGQDVHWMEPRDLSFDDMTFLFNDPNGKLSSHKHRGTFAATAGHNAITLDGLSPFELRSMFLIHPDVTLQPSELGFFGSVGSVPVVA